MQSLKMVRIYDTAGDKNANYRHGLTDNKSFRHPVYTAWQNMRGRCLRPNSAKYARYGGRGITICPQWSTSAAFAEWAFASGWKAGLTLDRIDNDGNYEPSNCRWISQGLNSRKKSTTKLSETQADEIRRRIENGENENVLAREYGVVHGSIWFIIKNRTHLDID